MRKRRIPARVGRPSPPIVLTRRDRKTLNKISLREGVSRHAIRVRIVLASSHGQPGVEIARTLRVSVQTVAKWRARYLAEGLPGLAHRRSRRPGARLEPDLAGKVKRLAEAEGATTRDIAKALGISPASVVRLRRGSRWPSRAGVSKS